MDILSIVPLSDFNVGASPVTHLIFKVSRLLPKVRDFASLLVKTLPIFLPQKVLYI